MNCNYRNCGEIIPSDENGNRRYCNDNCYMAEKIERSKVRYIKPLQNKSARWRKSKFYCLVIDIVNHFKRFFVNTINNLKTKNDAL